MVKANSLASLPFGTEILWRYAFVLAVGVAILVTHVTFAEILKPAFCPDWPAGYVSPAEHRYNHFMAIGFAGLIAFQALAIIASRRRRQKIAADASPARDGV